MSASPAPEPALTLVPERPQDGPMVDALVNRAFGPGHYAKASERVREFAAFAPELSMCAWAGDGPGGRLLGCVRLWRVRAGGKPVVFLGPFAVEQGERGAGFGQRLIERACEAAAAAGETHVLLVGDEAYFGRVDFTNALGRGVTMPGPVDQRRVLARELVAGAGPLSGTITPP
jgi:predicted N-acetyltransferase YhbS